MGRALVSVAASLRVWAFLFVVGVWWWHVISAPKVVDLEQCGSAQGVGSLYAFGCDRLLVAGRVESVNGQGGNRLWEACRGRQEGEKCG